MKSGRGTREVGGVEERNGGLTNLLSGCKQLM